MGVLITEVGTVCDSSTGILDSVYLSGMPFQDLIQGEVLSVTAA